MRRPSHFIADTEETVDEKTDDDVTGDIPTLRGVDDSSGVIKDTEENSDVPEPTEEQTEKTPEGGFFARLFRRKNVIPRAGDNFTDYILPASCADTFFGGVSRVQGKAELPDLCF